MKVKNKYQQGATVAQAKAVSGLAKIIKLGSNENVLGASPIALAAIRDSLDDLHLYPGDHEAQLTEKLAAKVGGGLNSRNFTTGNGSCDVLRQIAQAHIKPGDEALIAAPTFAIYKMLTEQFGGRAVEIPLKDWRIDLPALRDAITPQTKLVFICNPNNPTGTYVPHDELADFLTNLPQDVVAVVDEAYMEFADAPDFPQVAELIAAGYQLIVTRTFSKLYGLASLRMGYGFGAAEVALRARECKLHFNSGRVAWLGAAAALSDEAHVVETLEMVNAGKRFFYQELAQMGIGYLPSQAIFIFLTELPLDAQFICDEAMKRGVIIRNGAPFGLPDHIRITVGRQSDNERVVEVLEEIIAGAGLAR